MVLTTISNHSSHYSHLYCAIRTRNSKSIPGHFRLLFQQIWEARHCNISLQLLSSGQDNENWAWQIRCNVKSCLGFI